MWYLKEQQLKTKQMQQLKYIIKLKIRLQIIAFLKRTVLGINTELDTTRFVIQSCLISLHTTAPIPRGFLYIQVP